MRVKSVWLAGVEPAAFHNESVTVNKLFCSFAVYVLARLMLFIVRVRPRGRVTHSDYRQDAHRRHTSCWGAHVLSVGTIRPLFVNNTHLRLDTEPPNRTPLKVS